MATGKWKVFAREQQEASLGRHKIKTATPEHTCNVAEGDCCPGLGNFTSGPRYDQLCRQELIIYTIDADSTQNTDICSS